MIKHQSFVLRAVSLVLIAAALLTYNQITKNRLAAEEAALAAAPVATTSAVPTGDGTGAEVSAGLYKDGTYEGSAEGYGGPINVSVVVKDGRIASVAVLSHDREDVAYYSMAEGLIPQIISAQSTAIDTVSGATFSSNGILNAVDEALKGAVN